MNTTKTLERTSTVLAAKCADTEKNMHRLMREAGCPDAKLVRVAIPLIPGVKDDVVFAGLNGAFFYFLRGKTATMPEPVKTLLQNAGALK